MSLITELREKPIDSSKKPLLYFVIKFLLSCKISDCNYYNNTSCIEWKQTPTTNGYGRFFFNGKTEKRAHRVAWEFFVGEIPEGLVIDHLCHNRICVNTLHLEPVTTKENVRRGLSGFFSRLRQISKTHCPKKHPYSKENTYITNKGFRECKECKKIYYQNKKKQRIELSC